YSAGNGAVKAASRRWAVMRSGASWLGALEVSLDYANTLGVPNSCGIAYPIERAPPERSDHGAWGVARLGSYPRRRRGRYRRPAGVCAGDPAPHRDPPR